MRDCYRTKLLDHRGQLPSHEEHLLTNLPCQRPFLLVAININCFRAIIIILINTKKSLLLELSVFLSVFAILGWYRSLNPVHVFNHFISVKSKKFYRLRMDNMFEQLFPRTEEPEIKDVDSTSAILKYVSNGIIKDPFTFDYKIHEKCPTPPVCSDEKRKTVERFWRDAYLKSLNKVISQIQDWFTKISFKNKVNFTVKVIGLMVDSRKLFDLAYFIGPPTKDWVYSHTQFTRSPSDVAATDHNRALDDSTYDLQSSHYIEWFQSLNPREQFDAVVGLVHLGGTALEENIYGRLVSILEEKERDVIRKRVLQYLKRRQEMGSVKFVASKVAQRKQKLRQSLKTVTSKAKLKFTKSEPQVEGVNHLALLQQKIAEYDNAIKAMENVGESHIDSKPRKAKTRNWKDKKFKAEPRASFSNKRLNRLNAGLDRVQMLPLWDNRRIISLLADRSRSEATKVNKYWKEMVERTQKEISVRKKINNFLRKESAEPRHARRKSKEKEEFKGHQERKPIRKKRDTLPIIDKKVSRPKDDDVAPEDYHEHLDPHVIFKDDPPKLMPFSNSPGIYVICNEYCDDRAMDANKRWAAYSKKMDVEFCNVVFGVPCNIKLENAHKSKISCVYFHPNDASLVFTGGNDGHVKLHDVWKKRVKMVYAGHKGIVSDVVANCRYVASCGMDNTIRVFNIGDGRSMMCMAESPPPCRLLMTNCTFPLLYVANVHGEIIMYSVRDSDNPHRIGKAVSAHHGEVTSMNHYPCVLLTTGVDGFVRMWATNFEKPFWILSLKHPMRVNSAAMSYRKIISAGEDGKLRIWDVMSGVCEKVISITPTGRPILDMRCIKGLSSVKLVLNTEADIRVVEFLLMRKPVAKKIGRYKGSKLKPIGEFKKKVSPVQPVISSYDKRMMKLQMRQAVLPPIRPSQNVPYPETLQDRQENYQLIQDERPL